MLKIVRNLSEPIKNVVWAVRGTVLFLCFCTRQLRGGYC